METNEKTIRVRLLDKLREVLRFTWKKNVKGVRLAGWWIYMSRRPMRLRTVRAYDRQLYSRDRRELFETLWKRSGGRCEICGRQMDRDSRTRREHTEATPTCHHVIPLSMGVQGTAHDIGNITLICERCHKALHANPLTYSLHIIDALHARGLNPLDYWGDKREPWKGWKEAEHERQ